VREALARQINGGGLLGGDGSVGGKIHMGENSIYRGKSHLLVAKVDSSRILTKTEPNLQTLLLESIGDITRS
jgi:hypothetical protein